MLSPKTILMFRVDEKKIRVGRETGTTHIFYLSLIYSEMTLKNCRPKMQKFTVKSMNCQSLYSMHCQSVFSMNCQSV